MRENCVGLSETTNERCKRADDQRCHSAAAGAGDAGGVHLRGDGLVHEHKLECGASLAVVRERAGDAFGDSVVDVAVGHHDGQVLRVECQARLEPVRLRVRLDQRVGRLRAADEGEDVDLARLHDRRHRRAAGARDEVDHAGGEHLGVHLHRADVREAAHVRKLHHDRVAHQQRRDQRAAETAETRQAPVSAKRKRRNKRREKHSSAASI
eukprot:6212498-Pleurochrysis_carterae.AAC.1